MPFRYLVVHSYDATFQYRPKALNGIGGNISDAINAVTVVYVKVAVSLGQVAVVPFVTVNCAAFPAKFAT